MKLEGMFGRQMSKGPWWAPKMGEASLGQSTIMISPFDLIFDSHAVPLVLGPSSWGFGIFPRPGNFYFPGSWNSYLPEVLE